jgi:hypothetical protein
VRASTHLGVFFLLLLRDLCSYMCVCGVAVPASCCREVLRQVASLTSCRCTALPPPRTCMSLSLRCFIVLLFHCPLSLCGCLGWLYTDEGWLVRTMHCCPGSRRATRRRDPADECSRTNQFPSLSVYVCHLFLLGDKTNMHDWFAGKSILSSPRMERYCFCLILDLCADCCFLFESQSPK